MPLRATKLKKLFLIHFKSFAKSIWLFPAILVVILIALTIFRINGSSIGTYHKLFYGNQSSDNQLLANQPRNIRSDEWLVNTQMALAQDNNGYKRVNENLGYGQDVSVVGEAPYKDWSSIFKPHNWGYFFLPFDYAFSFRWWLIAFLLILSVYLLVLSLLPGKRMYATLISLAFYFSPFIQWWYLVGTLSSLYFSIFAGLIVVKILDQKQIKIKALLSLLLFYVLTSFALILYPPFQIPCAIVLAVFSVGIMVEKYGKSAKRDFIRSVSFLFCAAVAALAIVALFMYTRSTVIQTMKQTAYPGRRIQKSGGFDALHFFSSNLGAQLQAGSKEGFYRIGSAPTNQSEASNFILLIPFLFVPSLILLSRRYRKYRAIDWPLLTLIILFLCLLMWLFVPGISVVGKFTLLQNVPHARLLIGIGLLNLFVLILFIRNYLSNERFGFRHRSAITYSIVLFGIELLIGKFIMETSPNFISTFRVVAFSLPLPLITYLLIRKRVSLALIGLLAFSLFSTFKIHPVYQGTDILTNTALSQAIKKLSAENNYRWATELLLLENFVYMNGAPSLSGVYIYPQLDLWRDADPDAPEDYYNRYAHTNFAFDRDPATTIETDIILSGGDHFTIVTEPCSNFLKNQNVKYLLTSVKLNPDESCIKLVDEVEYPAQGYYIYKITP